MNGQPDAEKLTHRRDELKAEIANINPESVMPNRKMTRKKP